MLLQTDVRAGLSRTTATVTEGTSATYTVSLSAQPAADTILTITSDNSAVTTSVHSNIY